MRIAFWNTHNNININHIITDMICENKIDIIVLAEYDADEQELLGRLWKRNVRMEQYITFGCDRIVMFGSVSGVMPSAQNKYYSIQIIDKSYIVCGIHLPSQIYAGHQERRNIVVDTIIREINGLESSLKMENTIVLGDFNENPYEPGCLSADKFHGIPSNDDALKSTRKVMGRHFKMFYNPMWNLFGDFRFPPGTYYHNGSNPKQSFWHIYDQVIIRPGMREKFVEKSLKILFRTKNDIFVDHNKHPRKDISDHLPIIFEIKEEQI